MAQSTLVDYFGETLADLIDRNDEAIAASFGMNLGDVQDPDRLFAHIYLRMRSWLIVDGTNENGITIEGFGSGNSMGQTVGDSGRYGYQDQITFWVENTNNPTLIAGNVY